MRRTIHLAPIVLCFNLSARATTWVDVTVTCPIDGTAIEGGVPGSAFIGGSSSDFRPYGPDLTTAGLIACPTCHFTAPPEKYDNPGAIDLDAVRDALSQLPDAPYFRLFDAAMVVERRGENDMGVLGRLAMSAKWAADDTGEADVIRERTIAAITALQAYLDSMEAEDEERTAVLYLVGELHRQQGEREPAVEWLVRSLATADDEMKVFVSRRLFFTRHDGQSLDQVFTAAQAGSDAERVAAIPLLRSSDDPAVIDFLQQVVLTCEPDLREAAIGALVSETDLWTETPPSPRREHLAIFLAALRNDHFRTVQRGAYAVELLGAEEAAPIILEVLENPVGATDYRLLEALRATATAGQVDALRTIPGARAHQTVPAIHTRQPSAVQWIVEQIELERLVFYEDRDLREIAAFPELMRALGATSAGETSRHVYVKALRFSSDRDGAIATLKNYLGENRYTAIEAAISLAALGDRSGKTVLMDHIDSAVSITDGYTDIICTLLDESDYDRLYEAIQSSTQRRRASIEDTRQFDEERGMLSDDARRYTFDEELQLHFHLPLLASTGNSKVIPLLRRQFDNTRPQIRAGAAAGMTHVYTPQLGELLRERLPQEDSWVRVEIIKTLGNSGDVGHVPTLLRLIQQPTHVNVKLAWIEAMMQLNPAAARPALETWTQSPNKRLAEAAARALTPD